MLFILIAVRVGSDLSQVTVSVKQNSQLQEPGVSFLPVTGPVSSKHCTAFTSFQPSSGTRSRLFIQAEPYLPWSLKGQLEILSRCKIFALPRAGFTQDTCLLWCRRLVGRQTPVCFNLKCHIWQIQHFISLMEREHAIVLSVVVLSTMLKQITGTHPQP